MKQLQIGIALANLPNRDIAKEIDRYFAENTNGQIRSVFVPGEGGLRGAAFDYWGILSKAADIIEVGLAVYGAYKIVEINLRGHSNHNSDIYIVAPFPDHKMDLWVGRSGLSREEFLRDFQAKLLPLLSDTKQGTILKSKAPQRRRGPAPRKKRRRLP